MPIRRISKPARTNGVSSRTESDTRRKKPQTHDANHKVEEAASLDKRKKALNKRKRADQPDRQVEVTKLVEPTQPTKKVKTSSALFTSSSLESKARKTGKTFTFNEAPTAPLDVFVFGDGSCGELGLGSKEIDGVSPVETLYPRLNNLLFSHGVGVVQIACGGMHTVALTKDNKILTWGVNDLGALGRDTKVEEDGDDLLNPAESTPSPVDTEHLGSGIVWTQVVASDNASFALTEDGKVYGWGTFRSSERTMGFSSTSFIQKTPVLVPDLRDIRQLAAGNNHILALDEKGKVFAWGSGEQNQLARRWFAARPRLALGPTSIGALPVRGAKAVRVSCGSYHSFAIDQQGRVYAWGLNNYGGLGIPDDAGEDGASQLKPRLVENLQDYQVVDIAAGEHHSLACTSIGELVTWGRIDGYQAGHRAHAFTPHNTVFDSHGRPRILKIPLVVPDLPPIASVASGTDHSFALTVDGKAYTWGFGASGRTGLGNEGDIEIPTLIDNMAVRDRKLIFAGAGGAFSVLASLADIA
ncbi:hypothetical protein JX265_000240 [Neoarthrinium moseri]|uniref:RCC1-like domain-containing protein n=1 Tax=Neoarthrinium moseri TaxID=1658444 RepID=A0A9P9WYD9_9PEZI|nr:hypothetical protein JX265_000240 [Neoarthrinium moseri]